jgi:hypothetical protein
VKRRFNYTDRKRIPRDAVQIALKAQGNGPPAFDATVDLKDMELPDGGRVFIEAYYRSSYMRFDFGTVGNIRSEDDRTLRDIDNREHLQFRIKVVEQTGEHGKLLAEADRIMPIPSGGPAERIGILAVKLEDLGNQAWNLDLTDTSIPTLIVNREIGSKEYVRSNETFFALVFPAVVREILTQVLIIDTEQKFEPDAESEDWQERWLYFVSSMAGVDPLPAADADHMTKVEWIDQAVRVFCNSHQACRTFLDSCKEEAA